MVAVPLSEFKFQIFARVRPTGNMLGILVYIYYIMLYLSYRLVCQHSSIITVLPVLHLKYNYVTSASSLQRVLRQELRHSNVVKNI